MIPRRPLLFWSSVVVVGGAMIFAGCSLKSGDNNTTPAHVRFVHVIPDAGSLTINVAGSQIGTTFPFESVTTYQDVNAGAPEFRIGVAAGTTSTIIDATYNVGTGAKYSYVMFGTLGAPSAIMLSDTFDQSGPGLFRMRLVNATVGVGPVDAYLTGPLVDLTTVAPSIVGALPGGVPTFFEFPAGSYRLRLTPQNSKSVIYDAPVRTFDERSATTTVVYTRGSGTLVNAALLNMDDNGTGGAVNSGISQLKLVQGSPSTSPLNLFVDGTLTFAGVPYTGASSYSTFSPGTHTIRLESSSTPGAALATLTTSLGVATDASIVASGPSGAIVLTALADTNLPPVISRARVRFVNASANAGPLDIYVNFSRTITALAQNAASGYTEYPNDLYTIAANPAGSGSPVLTIPGVQIGDPLTARTYTFYVMGTANALSGVLIRDD